MTREEARKATEVMMAYADGKEIEFFNVVDEWSIIQGPSFNWAAYNYRIKPEPTTYRPFKDKDECWNEMQKHQPFGWVKKTNSDPCIGDSYTLVQHISDIVDYRGYFAKYTFVDGAPFGIKEE